MKKLMLFSLLAIGLVSCSKDDDVQPIENNSDFKIEIALSGAIDDYSESLTATIFHDEGANVNLLGDDLPEKQQTSPQTASYTITGEPKNRTFTTSAKAKNVVLMQMMVPKKENPQHLTSVVTVYENGKVKAKKTHVFNGEINNYLLVD